MKNYNHMKVFLIIIISGFLIITTCSCGIFRVIPPDGDTEDIDKLPDGEPNTHITPDTDVTVPTLEPIEDDDNNPEEEIITFTYPGKDLSVSGTILSDSRNLIKLHIEWNVTQSIEDEYAVINTDVFIDCYGIKISSRSDCKFTINGNEIIFAASAIDHDVNSFSSILIYSNTSEVYSPADIMSTVDIAASYYFGGTYGGYSIGWLEVSGSIVLDQAANENYVENYVKQIDPLAPELPENPFKPIITIDKDE
ncbi:MAG: hypothetical protein FWF15_01745 [Oscillospiraceae bacterium]|nr:hypothetical protein [Oscillospiraceae bacterium]